ncbi:MAG: hypothetical protein ACREAY_01785 [Nitrososphaera sp.]|uniref:beta strand repeat-containing protein n=1 Tax=Nitrososphaera sp. TaxID=1971748 RepID=UPI003D6FB456
MLERSLVGFTVRAGLLSRESATEGHFSYILLALVGAAVFFMAADTNDVFADSALQQHAPDASAASESGQTYARQMADSVSVASYFDNPASRNFAARTFARGISDGVSVASEFGGPAGQTAGTTQARTLGPQQPAGPRIDSNQRILLGNNKMDGRLYGTGAIAQSGTPVAEVATIEAGEMDFSEVATLSEGGSDPDDSSKFSRQIAAAKSYIAMEKSMQNAVLVNTSISAVLLAGAIVVVVARQPAVSGGRMQRRMLLTLFLIKRANDDAAPNKEIVPLTSVILLVMAVFVVSSIATATPSSAQEYGDGAGKSRIEISSAYHLDSEGRLVGDIYDESRRLDGIWSEEIADGHRVRVTFEQSLTSTKDITIYPRIISGTPRIQVYEINGNELVAEFTSINSNEYSKVFLTNLQGSQDTFDLRVLGGSVEFDYIVDPPPLPTYVGAGTSADGTGTITPALPGSLQTNDILLLFVETANEAVTISNQNGGTWTEVTNSPQGTGTTPAGTRLTVFWSRYNGSQGNPTVSDSGNHQLGVILAFRGVITTGDPWDVTSGNVDATVNNSLSATGATTTVANALVVVAAAIADDNQDFGATWTNANLANITTRSNIGTTQGNDGRLGIITGEKATASAYAATTNTLTGNNVKGMMTIALKPAPFSRSPSDSLAVSDSTFIRKVLSRSLSDAATVSDSAARVHIISKSMADTVTTTDAAARTALYQRSNSDSLAVTDSIAKMVAYARSISDTVSLADSVASAISFARAVAEPVTITDSAERTYAPSRSISDLISVTDSAAGTTAYSRSTSDTLATTDSIARTATFARSASDTVAATDAINLTYGPSRSITDALFLTDSADHTTAFARSVADAVTLTDAAITTEAYATAIADSVAATDAIARATTFTRSISDSVTVDDLASRNNFTTKLVSDSLTVADAVMATAALNMSVSDSVSIMDSIGATALTSRSIADTITATDAASGTASLARSISDSVAVIDEIAKTLSAFRSIAGSIAFADGMARSLLALRSASDPLGVTDSIARTVAYAQAVADSLATTDSIARMAAFTSSISDTITAADSAAGTYLASRSTADALLVADAIASTYPASRSVAETLSMTDATARTVVYARSIADAVALADSISYALAASRLAADGVAVTDTVSATTSASRSMTDALVVTDSVVATTSATRFATDILAVTDATKQTLFASRQISDALAVTDAASAKVGARTVSDAVTIADAITARITATAISDSLAITDAITARITAISISDTLSATDLVSARVTARSLPDELAIADTVTAKIGSRNVADSITVADALAAKITGRSASDSVAVTDVVKAAVNPRMSDSFSVADVISTSVTHNIVDAVSVTDAVAAKTMTTRDAANDMLNIDDKITRSVTYRLADAVSIFDQAEGASQPPRMVADAVVFADKIRVSVTRSLSDSVTVQDSARPTSITVTIADSLGIAAETRIVSARINIADSIGIGDSARPASIAINIADALAVADETRKSSVAVNIADSLTVVDQTRPTSLSVITADSLAIADQVKAVVPPRTTDSIAVTEAISIHVNRMLADAVAVSDVVSVVAGKLSASSNADSLAIADAIAVTSGKIVSINDTLTVGAALTNVSVHWNRNFSEEFVLGECTPFACNQVLHFGEFMALGDEFAPPPVVADAIAVGDSIARTAVLGRGLSDAVGIAARAEWTWSSAPTPPPPGSPAPLLNMMMASNASAVRPLPGAPVGGTFTMLTASQLVDQLNPPTLSIGGWASYPDPSKIAMVLPTYQVNLVPTQQLPGDDALVTVRMASVPANMPVLMPIDLSGTPQTSEHSNISWMKVEYTPKVNSTDFAMVLSIIDSPPADAPQLSGGIKAMYMDFDWVGSFSGADPGASGHYKDLPTFTFAVSESWASQQGVQRDSNRVPVMSLSLLDEAAGAWRQVSAIDSPAAPVNGQYVYVAHLEHFSTYAVTATKAPAPSGGTQGGNVSPGTVPPVVAGAALAVDLAESLAVGDVQDSVPVEVIEEFGQKKLSVRIADTVGIFIKPVSYRTFQVGDIEVRITVQDVRQENVIPPKATATFLVEMDNLGGKDEKFTLNFWYYDQSGNRPYESSQVAEVGPHESRQLLVDVPFTEPGVFEVTAEARSIPGGDLVNTAQLTVTIPWLAINLYVLVVVAIAILGASGGVMAVFLRSGLAGAGAGTALFLIAKKRNPAIRVTDRLASIEEEEYDIVVEVRQREAQDAQAVFDLEIVNRTGRTQEFMLKYWAADSSGIRMSERVEKVRIKGRTTEVRAAQVVLPPGRNIFVVEAGPVSEKQARWGHAGVRVKND